MATRKNLARQRNKEATMRRYLTIRNKEVHLGLLITLIVVSMVATVYALTSYVFHQTLVVPGTAIKIYPNQPISLPITRSNYHSNSVTQPLYTYLYLPTHIQRTDTLSECERVMGRPIWT